MIFFVESLAQGSLVASDYLGFSIHSGPVMDARLFSINAGPASNFYL